MDEADEQQQPEKLALLKQALRDQLGMLHLFYTNEALFGPMLIIWVASFGGALHYPVTTFYLLELGASSSDIGRIDSIATLGSLIGAPLYGILLDRGTDGAYYAIMLASFCCSTGCLLRALASGVDELHVAAVVLGAGSLLWNVVLSYVSSRTAEQDRSKVVSAFLVEEQTLRLVGKGLYPLLDAALVALPGRVFAADLPRFRLEMGICPAFCLFGLLKLSVADSSVLRRPPEAAMQLGRGESGGSEGKKEGAAASCDVRLPAAVGSRSLRIFVLLSCSLVCQSAASTAVNTLWPLWVRDAFSYGPNEFGVLVLVSSLAACAAVATVPAVEMRIGAGAAPVVAMLLAAAAVGGFMTHSLVVHACGACTLVAAIAFAEPSLKALATTALPKRLSGSSFGLLRTLQGVGSVIGSLVATSAYDDLGSGVFLGAAAVLLAAACFAAFALVCRGGRLGV